MAAPAPELALGLAALALLASGSCGGGRTPGSACADAACPEDAPLYAQPCSGKIVASLPAQDCPAQACSGPTAYAVCNGEVWSRCACSVPPGYSLVDAGFFGPEGGAEGGAEMDAGAAPRDAAPPVDAHRDRE